MVVYATRRRERALELLVFDHRDFSDAGTQVPAGGIGQDEEPKRAALRELREETSVVGCQARMLGRATEIHPDGHACDNWYFHVAVDDRRSSWTHAVSAGAEDEGLVLECRFLPLGEASKRLHPSQHTFLDALRTRSRRRGGWGPGTGRP